MTATILTLVIALALLPLAFLLVVNLSLMHGVWRWARVLGRGAPYVLGSTTGSDLAFFCEGFALREAGRVTQAAALAKARVAEKRVPAWVRNVAIDIMISAGEYEMALSAEPPMDLPASPREALSLAMIQINLAEADYNLGRWDAAEERLRALDQACWRFPIARAGLLQQRAWIAAHRGRAAAALELCAQVNPRCVPPIYRAEYHFTRAAALLAAGQLADADVAIAHGEELTRRLSSERNGLFLRARVAAAREDWVGAERLCREAAGHSFRGQGGSGLFLWAQALTQLERHAEADDALRLAAQRDPESEAARAAARPLS